MSTFINKRLKYNFLDRLEKEKVHGETRQGGRESILELLKKEDEKEHEQLKRDEEEKQKKEREKEENERKQKLKEMAINLNNRKVFAANIILTSSEKQLAMKILMSFDNEGVHMKALKDIFMTYHHSKLSRVDFVKVMKEFLQEHEQTANAINTATQPSKRIDSTSSLTNTILQRQQTFQREDSFAELNGEKNLVLSLCELFNDMDFDGDKYIEWEDFTSYLIETASDQQFTLATIKDYGWKKTLSGSEVEDSVKKICFFEDWDKIVTCGKSKKVKILDPDNDYATIAVLPDHDGTILNAEYIPQPYNLLVTSSADLCLRFWDARNRDFDHKHQEQMDASITVMKYFQKHDTLFTASRTGDLHLWKWGNIPEHYKRKRVGSKEESTQPRQQHALSNTIRSSPMQKQQPANSSVINMNSSKREMFYVLDTHTNIHNDVISDMLLLPKENRIVMCSMDSTIKMFDIDKKEVTITLKGHKQGVFAVTWCSEYQFLISAGFEHEALVWTSNIDAPPFKLRDQRKPHQHSLVNVVAVPNSPQVVTADHKGMVKIWDVRTFNCVQTIYTESNLPKNDYHSFYLNSFTYMDKRKEIVTAGRRIHVYEYERTANPKLADDQPISICVYNPSTFTFLTVAGCDIKVWDALTGCIQKVYKDISSSEITALALDDRGRKFFIGNHKGKITAHNSMNGTLVKKFTKHHGEVTSLSYTDDSMKYLISTSWDTKVRILSDRDQSEGIDARQPLTIHEMDVKVSSYHKQFCVAATGDVTGKILIIDVRSLKWGGVECNQHRGEITAIKFLGIFPAFVSADSAGYLHLWTIKPYPINPHKKLLEWRNHTFTPLQEHAFRESPFMTQREEEEEITTFSVPQIPVDDSQQAIPVTCIDFDSNLNFLYTGDEKGYVVCWDMNEIVDTANLRYSGRGTGLTPANQSNLNINQLRENWEKLKHHRLQRAFYWKAHTDCIKTIQIVKDPPCIITAGYDSAVNIWTKKGELMDCLKQDRKDGQEDEFSRKKQPVIDNLEDFKPFNFPVNLEKRRREDAQTVSNVINRIKKQLRIITLWKNKSKTTLVSRSQSSMSNMPYYDENDDPLLDEKLDEDEEEYSPVPSASTTGSVTFNERSDKTLPEIRERDNALRTIIEKNRTRRAGSPSSRPMHSPVRRSTSQHSLSSRKSSAKSVRFPTLQKQFLPDNEDDNEIIEEDIE